MGVVLNIDLIPETDISANGLFTSVDKFVPVCVCVCVFYRMAFSHCHQSTLYKKIILICQVGVGAMGLI